MTYYELEGDEYVVISYERVYSVSESDSEGGRRTGEPFEVRRVGQSRGRWVRGQSAMSSCAL